MGQNRITWASVGDLERGRPNLGPTIRIEAYRLMHYAIRDAVEHAVGAETANRLLRSAGYAAGRAFHGHAIGAARDLADFAARAQAALREAGIGILRVERADVETGEFVVTVSEDADCSGLPDAGITSCVYNEGFIAALLESFSGRPFRVDEVDCWSSGSRICRFVASARPV